MSTNAEHNDCNAQYKSETLIVILEAVKLHAARIDKTRAVRCLGMRFLRGTVIQTLRAFVQLC